MPDPKTALNLVRAGALVALLGALAVVARAAEAPPLPSADEVTKLRGIVAGELKRTLDLEIPEGEPVAVAYGGPAAPYYDGVARKVLLSKRSKSPRDVLLHELTHAALGDLFEDAEHTRYSTQGWPVWFEEGLAEHVARRHSLEPAGRRTALVRLILAERQGRRPSVAELMVSRVEDFRGPDASSWYASAWALTDMLASSKELRPRMRRWVAALREGHNGAQSFLAKVADAEALEARLTLHIGVLMAGASFY